MGLLVRYRQVVHFGRGSIYGAMLVVSVLAGCSSTRTAGLLARANTAPVASVAPHRSAPLGVPERRPTAQARQADDSDHPAFEDSSPIVQTAGLADDLKPESASTNSVLEVASTEVAPLETTPSGNDSAPPAGTYPLNLSGVLSLADGQNPQVILARERIQEAYAQVERAEVLWIPSLRAGLNYNKHEGTIQDVAGNVFTTSRGSLYGGLGAGAVGAGSPSVPGLAANFHLSDALFQPTIARFQASSRQFASQAARNDVLCDSAVAYLELLRAERRLAVAIEARVKTERIVKLTGDFARVGQGAVADHDRSLAELAARDGDLSQAEEAVETAAARLAFLIRVAPGTCLTTQEPFIAPLQLMSGDSSAQELVAQGLSRRPELAEHRQLVGEACERLRREQYAPLIPSVLLGLSYGGFGGGLGSRIANTSDRFDGDAVVYWELRNMGFGEQAIRAEASSRLRQAQWREVLVMDRIAQEVVEAHAQVVSRRKRIELTKRGIEAAQRSYDLNLQRIENAKGLPLEALQAVQALAQSRRDYLNAVIDHNIAQVRLCRATGWFEEGTLPAVATPVNQASE